MAKKRVVSSSPDMGLGGFIRRADAFEIGDRVEMSPEAERAGLRPGKASGRKGRVVGIKPPFSLTVHQDGYAKPRRFAAGFWKRVERKRRKVK